MRRTDRQSAQVQRLRGKGRKISKKNEKIKIYKRALALKTFEELEDLHKELEDRFGRLKSEAKGFFEFLKIRIRARELGIVSIKEDKEKRLLINFNEEKINVDKIEQKTVSFLLYFFIDFSEPYSAELFSAC